MLAFIPRLKFDTALTRERFFVTYVGPDPGGEKGDNGPDAIPPQLRNIQRGKIRWGYRYNEDAWTELTLRRWSASTSSTTSTRRTRQTSQLGLDSEDDGWPLR